MAIKVLRERIRQGNPNLDDAQVQERVRWFAENSLFGTDINDRMARVAKMNMIMHGDGHSGIFNMSGLYIDPAAPAKAKENIREGNFDITTPAMIQ
jgi:type I restriction-modification system DNA methylase subunit